MDELERLAEIVAGLAGLLARIERAVLVYEQISRQASFGWTMTAAERAAETRLWTRRQTRLGRRASDHLRVVR
jgi:hypothetical protein